MFAKGNQPTLHEDLRLFFHDPPVDCRGWPTERTCERGHGRLEIREIVASTELNDFLATPWPGIAQVYAPLCSQFLPGSSPVHWITHPAELNHPDL